MDQARLGRSDIVVSRIVLGTSMFGAHCDPATTRTIVDAYLDAGGGAFDTANLYGLGATEQLLGEVLGARRSSVVIASKVGRVLGADHARIDLSRQHVLDSLDATLRRLDTDYLDLYQTHGWDDVTPVEEVIDTFEGLVRAGTIRAYGCSNLLGWQISAMATLGEHFTSGQLEYSLTQRSSELERIPACQHFGLAFLPWSPLGGGLLTGKYAEGQPAPPDSRGETTTTNPFSLRLTRRNWEIVETVRAIASEIGKSPAQVALRWVLDQPGITAPIIGARTLDQLLDNLGSLGWSLPQDALDRLTAASDLQLVTPYVSPRGL